MNSSSILSERRTILHKKLVGKAENYGRQKSTQKSNKLHTIIILREILFMLHQKFQHKSEVYAILSA